MQRATIKTSLGRAVLAASLISCSAMTNATELSVLGGFQFNSDLIVAEDAGAEALQTTSAQPGSDISVDNGAHVALAIDFATLPDPTDRIGLYLSRHETEIGATAGLSDGDMTVTHIHFTGSKLYPMGAWENFATAGIGATLLEPNDITLQSSTEFSINVGGGTQYKVSDSLLIRFEARWLPIIGSTNVAGICGRSCVIAFDSSIYNQFQLSAGFSLRF